MRGVLDKKWTASFCRPRQGAPFAFSGRAATVNVALCRHRAATANRC